MIKPSRHLLALIGFLGVLWLGAAVADQAGGLMLVVRPFFFPCAACDRALSCSLQDNNAAVKFGPQGDVNLYRSASNTLSTDNNLVVSGKQRDYDFPSVLNMLRKGGIVCGNITAGPSHTNLLETISQQNAQIVNLQVMINGAISCSWLASISCRLFVKASRRTSYFRPQPFTSAQASNSQRYPQR